MPHGPAHSDPPANSDPDEYRREGDVSARPGDGSLSRVDAVKDEQIRQWDVTTPSATVIGRAENPEDDLGETVRRLHDEQHPAMAGHSARMHRLEKARITQAYCNALSLTNWERDRAIGLMTEVDLTEFGSQRAIENVALVVVQHVVDTERQHQLGLHDQAWLNDQPPEAFERLFERFDSIKDDPLYRTLLSAVDLDITSVNRLNRVLRDQIEDRGLQGAVLGRSPYRDPNLPAIRDRSTTEAANQSIGANADGESDDDS